MLELNTIQEGHSLFNLPKDYTHDKNGSMLGTRRYGALHDPSRTMNLPKPLSFMTEDNKSNQVISVESSKIEKSYSMSYDKEKRKFIMNTPMTKVAFEQFEKRYDRFEDRTDENFSSVKEKLEAINTSITKLDKSLSQINDSMLTEEKVNKIIENNRNKLIISKGKTALYILLSALASQVVSLLIK